MPTETHYTMPPEWAPHSRCWMAWPCRAEAWGPHLDQARRAYAEVARAIAQFEPVTMIARPDLTAQASLYCGAGISTLPLAQDDSWTRDTGPVFVKDEAGRLAGLDFRFNGWGEAYGDHAQDALMARRVLEHTQALRVASDMVCEGGAIHVDGEGTCLVCTPSILDPKRNPGLTVPEAEAELRRCLGVTKVIWLPGGLRDDETGGHVDNVACFVRPGLVLALAGGGRDDPDDEALSHNLETLRDVRDAQGRALEVLTVPQAKTRLRHDGTRLSLSYVNLYLANGAVLMPAFDDAADKAAFKVIAAAFPDRQVIQIDALEIVQGGGGIHCITLQQPRI